MIQVFAVFATVFAAFIIGGLVFAFLGWLIGPVSRLKVAISYWRSIHNWKDFVYYYRYGL